MPIEPLNRLSLIEARFLSLEPSYPLLESPMRPIEPSNSTLLIEARLLSLEPLHPLLESPLKPIEPSNNFFFEVRFLSLEALEQSTPFV